MEYIDYHTIPPFVPLGDACGLLKMDERTVLYCAETLGFPLSRDPHGHPGFRWKVFCTLHNRIYKMQKDRLHQERPRNQLNYYNSRGD